MYHPVEIICAKLCIDIPRGSTKFTNMGNFSENSIIDTVDARQDNHSDINDYNEVPIHYEIPIPKPLSKTWAPRPSKYPSSKTNNTHRRKINTYLKQPRNRGYNHNVKRKQW